MQSKRRQAKGRFAILINPDKLPGVWVYREDVRHATTKPSPIALARYAGPMGAVNGSALDGAELSEDDWHAVKRAARRYRDQGRVGPQWLFEEVRDG